MAEPKKKAPKRKRSDSASAEQAAIAAAGQTIEPPKEIAINSDQLRFWKFIIGSRAIDAWTPNDLMLAGMLARVYADTEKYSLLLSKTRLVKDAAGNPRVSPAHRIMDDLTKQALSLSRTLQIHPRATQGESRDQVKRNELYGAANSTMEAYPDDLIPRARH